MSYHHYYFSYATVVTLTQAFEHLIALEFVKPLDGSSAGTQKEFRLMVLLVDPSQIMEALQCYPDCPTELRHWAMNTAV